MALKQGLDFELLLMWGLLLGNCTLIAATVYPLRPITSKVSGADVTKIFSTLGKRSKTTFIEELSADNFPKYSGIVLKVNKLFVVFTRDHDKPRRTTQLALHYFF